MHSIAAGPYGCVCLVIRGTIGIEEQLVTRNAELFHRAQNSYDDLEQDCIQAQATSGESITATVPSKTITPPYVHLALERFDSQV